MQWRLYLPSKIMRAAWNNIFIVALVVISSVANGRGWEITVRVCEEESDIIKGTAVASGECQSCVGVQDEPGQGSRCVLEVRDQDDELIKPHTTQGPELAIPAVAKPVEMKWIREGGIKGFGEHKAKHRKWNHTEKFHDFRMKKHQTSRWKY